MRTMHALEQEPLPPSGQDRKPRYSLFAVLVVPSFGMAALLTYTELHPIAAAAITGAAAWGLNYLLMRFRRTR